MHDLLRVGTVRWLAPFCILLLTVLLTGCGSSGPPTAEVTGKVTYKGKPVEGGLVVFGGKNGPGSGGIEPDGTYVAPRVPIGEASVIVQVSPTVDVKKKGLPFPAKYSQPGTLTFTVKSGSNTFDINMQ